MIFYFPTAHDVRFSHHIAVEHQIDAQRVLRIGFKQFYVDLSGCRFIAVDDGRSAFTYLNRIHPWPGNIFQAEVLRQTTHTRCVLLQQLHIRTAQS